MRTRTTVGRAVAALVFAALTAALLVSVRSPATAAIAGDPLCVARPASTVADPTRILAVGDSITSAAAGDYTWRYFLWKHLVNPNGVASPAPAAYDFVGPYTYMVQPMSPFARESAEYNCDFPTNNGAIPGATMDKYTDATGLLLDSTRIKDMVQAADADALIVLAGLQDLGKGATADQVIADAHTVVSEAQKANAAVKIVVVTAPVKAVPDAKVADYNTKLVAQAPTWSTQTSPVVVAQAAKNWSTTALTYDTIHPNPQGEVGLAADIADALAQVGVGSPATRPVPNYAAYVGPRAPAVLAQPTISGSTVSLSWTLPPGSVASKVQRNDYTAGTGWQALGSTVFLSSSSAGPPYSSTYNDSTYVPGHVYQYRLISAKGTELSLTEDHVQFSTSITSNLVTVPAGATVPSTPGAVPGFSATPTVHGMSLAWGAATDATGYRYSWHVAGSSSITSKDLGAGARGVPITGLVAGKAYGFQVRALRAGVLGAPTIELTRVPKAYALARPAKPRLTTVSGHRIKATWGAIAHATRYQVQIRSVGGSWRTVASSAVRSYTSGRLVAGRSYEVRVRAYDGLVAGPFSPIARIRAK